MNQMSRRCTTLCAAAVLLAALGRSATSQQISNGGFEANGGAGFSSFADWTVADQIGSAGSFYAQTGTGSPLFGNLVPAPPEGQYAAMTDAGGAGAHVLYQDFVVPFDISSASLSFQVFINNQAGDFAAPNTLDYTAVPNQQARVDLMLASADPFSVAGSDILLNLFQTQSGDPLTSGYNLVTADITGALTAYEGDTLRLRFAETDNLAPLNFGVDAVNLTVVPEPSLPALLAACATAGISLVALRRQRLPKAA